MIPDSLGWLTVKSRERASEGLWFAAAVSRLGAPVCVCSFFTFNSTECCSEEGATWEALDQKGVLSPEKVTYWLHRWWDTHLTKAMTWHVQDWRICVCLNLKQNKQSILLVCNFETCGSKITDEFFVISPPSSQSVSFFFFAIQVVVDISNLSAKILAVRANAPSWVAPVNISG